MYESAIPDHRPLVPREAYFYFPQGEEIKIGAGKNQVRRIYEGPLEYDDFEMTMLEEFLIECYKQKINLSPQYSIVTVHLLILSLTMANSWKKWHILRFLQGVHFRFEKAIIAIQEHWAWRCANVPIQITDKIQEFLHSGIMYVHGRDNRFRPIIVINPWRLDVDNVDLDAMCNGIAAILECIVNNMLLPGQVENWIIVNDLNDMSMLSFPMTIIKKFLTFLQSNYRSRMYKMYIVNTPISMYAIWSVVKKLLEEVTLKKINIFKASNPPDMLLHINKEQLERRFGGTAPDKSSDYWPIRSVSDRYFVQTDQLNKILLSEEEYFNRCQSGDLNGCRIYPPILKRLTFKRGFTDEAMRLSDIEEETQIKSIQTVITNPMKKNLS